MKELIKTDWKELLGHEFSCAYMQELEAFLAGELELGKIIYPEQKNLFSCFNSTPFSMTKVVIIGQDPYHGPGQAHGLSFSVRPGVKVPPSLKNIYKELENDLGLPTPNHGYLQAWAEQGVLLLNSVLSVEATKAGSHQGKGWEKFTDQVIELLNEKKDHLVFILWGSPAQKKGSCIDESKHLVLKGPHPSPLSAYRGFFQRAYFSKANQYLRENKKTPIQWVL